MKQPFELISDGEVCIVGAVIHDNAPVQWRVTISGGPKPYAIGFTFEHVRCVK